MAVPTEILFLVDQEPDGGYCARAAGHAIVTQGDSLDELRSAVREAVACHFGDDHQPRIIRLHIVHDEVLLAPG